LTAMISAERACWEVTQPSAAFLIMRTVPLRGIEVDSSWRELCKAYGEIAEVERSRYPVQVIRNDSAVDEALRQIICITETG
jgi:hypothetical protein